MRLRLAFALSTLMVVVSPPLAAEGITAVTIDGNEVRATIDLAGSIAADLTVTFEEVVGLSEESLGLSAELVDPTDASILSRMPDPSLTGIPSAFPVRVWIEPPSGGPLSFSGIVAVELYTHNLSYTGDTPLRLFAAPAGGPFRDITEFMGTGSYRVRGSRGEFSEFLIVTDLRATSSVITEKFQHLDELLLLHSGEIAPAVLDELEQELSAARSAYAAGDRVAAIQQVEEFAATVHTHGGTEIPDVWRASRDLDNVAGALRAGALTLRFGLNLSSSL